MYKIIFVKLIIRRAFKMTLASPADVKLVLIKFVLAVITVNRSIGQNNTSN